MGIVAEFLMWIKHLFQFQHTRGTSFLSHKGQKQGWQEESEKKSWWCRKRQHLPKGLGEKYITSKFRTPEQETDFTTTGRVKWYNSFCKDFDWLSFLHLWQHCGKGFRCILIYQASIRAEMILREVSISNLLLHVASTYFCIVFILLSSSDTLCFNRW